MSNENIKIEVRDLRSGDWVWTHKNVLFSIHINPSVFKVYCGIASYAGNIDQMSWPSLQTLSTRLNMSKTTVIQAIKILESCGLIKIDRGDGICNTYYLLNCKDIKPPAVKVNDSPFHVMVDMFHRAAQKYRGVKVLWTPKDFSRLKAVIGMGLLKPAELEQLCVYFLASPKFQSFTPSMSVFLSNGILTSLSNSIKNDRNFWKDMDNYMMTFNGVGRVAPIALTGIEDLIKTLATKMAAPAKALKI